MSIFCVFLSSRITVVYGAIDDVVLVLAHRAAALGLEHADDAEREVLDPDRLADRVLPLEERVGDRRAEEADLRRGAHVGLGEEGALLDVPRRGRTATRRRRPGPACPSSGLPATTCAPERDDRA